jgi:flagellar motility protein MotE (MotC chaperone)
MRGHVRRIKRFPFTIRSRWPWFSSRQRVNRRASLWTMVGGLVVSTILFWVMVQLGQASSGSKQKTSPTSPDSVTQEERSEGENQASGDDGAKALAPPVTQGPAIDTPREVLNMLEQRKRDLDRREEALRQNEERLMIVRGQIEELLEQNEALEKRLQSEQGKALAEKGRQVQDQRMQLAKIFEAMPSEEAAARLEKMPDRKAVEILRMLKSKTAGGILAQVKADHAAKLTEQLMAHTP